MGDPRTEHDRDAMAAAGVHTAALAALPADVGTLARCVQGLLLHEHWAPEYGVTLRDEQRDGSHLRRVTAMLDALLAIDGRPLDVARLPAQRLVGVCRHFALLTVAVLRVHGVAARARCGFGTYFIPGGYEDHWVCERWDAKRGSWVLADTQIDELQRAALRPDFDLLDVPRDRFVIAADVWRACRSGAIDPGRCGIGELRGLWFVAGNVLRDAAALCGVEMLPWDVWGAMYGPDEVASPETLAFVDRVAALTPAGAADADLGALRAFYASDERLRVPAVVFNAIRNRPETV